MPTISRRFLFARRLINAINKTYEDRSLLKDSLLFRNESGKTIGVKKYQVLITEQLVNEVLGSLQLECGKHPGMNKRKSVYRQKD